jgi:hypothetical protein
MLQSSAFVIFAFVTAVLLFTTVSLLIWAKTAPTLDWLEAIFVAVVGTVIFTGWVSTVLATFGLFSLAAVAGLLLGVGVGLVLWKRPFNRPHFTPLNRTEWLLLILLLGSAVVYFRPHEYVLGGIDPGSYMNIAATMARTGDFVIEDEWTGILRQFPETTLREQPPQWRTRYLQFVGWYIDDNDPTRLIPQFFPFHPALIAVGVSLAGLYGGLFVTPLWGTLSLVTIYLLSRRLFNPNVALLAATLYAITPIHIYFARYPSTEPLTLLLVFSGLLGFQAVWDEREGSRLWGLFGGAAFGVAFLTRIDLPLVALLILGWLILVRWQKRWTPGWRTFTVTTAVLSLHAGLSAILLNAPYMWNTYGSLLNVIRNKWVVQLGLIGAGMLTAVMLWLMWRQSWQQFRAGRVAHFINGSGFRWLLAGGVVALSGFAYFIRPLLEPVRSYSTWPTGTTAWVLDGENWLRMGWYLTPLGLTLATLGLAWLLQRASFNRLGFFLSVGILTTLQYVYKIFNTPYHIYAMRRYVPIVLPMLMIYTAVFIIYFYQSRPHRLVKVGAGILTIGLMAGLLYQSRFVLPLRDLRGATDALVTLHEQVDPNALIIFSEPATATLSDTIGPPFRFIYGHDIATIRQDDNAAAPFIERMIEYEAENERPLQLIATAPIAPVLRERFDLQPVTFFPIKLPKLLSTFTGYPSAMQTVYYGIEIYDAIPTGGETAVTQTESLTIDIGSVDAAYIVDGFYGKEPLPGEITMRWTTDEAIVEIPDIDQETIAIDVRAKIFRPNSELEISPVIVWLDGETIGQFTPTTEWITYSFTATLSDAQSSSLLQFNTPTFNPSELQINNDARDLGFLLDWIIISTP